MTDLIQGETAAGFEPVRAAFEANFREDLEVGAAVCIFRKGERVVDLWGGHRDMAGTTPWTESTLVNVYSTTKGPAAIAFATLLEDGLIRYEDPVSEYWPELSALERLSVGDLLAHRGGLCGVDAQLAVTDLYDWPKMIGLLEAQRPFWPPGTASGYHAVTWGYLPGELVRRITGETLAERLQQRICAPAQADFYLGVPDAEMSRIAPLVGPNRARVQRHKTAGARGKPGPFHAVALQNPVIRPYQDASSKPWQQAEIAASNGHASARGVARIYQQVLRADGGILSSESLAALTEERVGMVDDLVLGHPIRRGAGVILNTRAMFGPNPEAWGHSGTGGSKSFADPITGTAFGYVMNQMRDDEGESTRSGRLIDAYYGCL
ncbi:MAG: class A beta-lactamase-related serine hydrolase [Gammaproteobacteria bacterium]|nr:MAG: class A beta-lactamase-related serine hydrolase [Gammaproteobacteria bacterium]